ncbi:MAG TPA: hypothetical protein VFA15_03850 [Nitrososphaera sp.]|nr:hypothetical protein [Nitrososphaera sp.]
MNKAVSVEVPIRYRRQSQSRGNTYTMTFVKDGPLGQGILVPCKASVSDTADLVSEAEELWMAEQPDAEPTSIGASWGCVGALFSERSLQSSLSLCWMKHFHSKSSPISPVDKDGFLNISWPNILGNGPAQAEIILATATKGKSIQPTPEQVAEAWINQDNGYEEYFFENVKHGIRTPEDGLIWEKIKTAKPKWLTEKSYAEVAAILETEARSGV